MKKSEISYQTKRRLADALKKNMARKSFDNITVTSLLEDCDITRSTFYYHFDDIYSLMIWMFDQEMVSLLEKSQNADTWSEGMLLIYQYVLDNSAVCRCALHSTSIGRSNLRRFFSKSCYAIMTQFALSLHVDAKEEHLQFIVRFYTDAMVGALIDWLESGMTKTPEEMIALYEIAMKGAVKEALERSANS